MMRPMIRFLVVFVMSAVFLPAQSLLRMDAGTSSIYEQGWDLAGSGDLNADGVPDVVVGCQQSASGSGTVEVISLADGSKLYTLVGEGSGHLFGAAVASGRDVDGDGVADILIGAPGYDVGNPFDNRGRAYVYSGASGSLLHTFTGAAAQDRMGDAVALLPDLNGDGRAEIAVGIPGANVLTGAVNLYSGIDYSLLHVFTGLTAGDRFGSAISSVGDLDGDQVPDILISAPYNVAGRVWIHSGATYAGIGFVDGTQIGEAFGFSLADAGDLNGDQIPDFVVGALDYDVGALYSAGRAVAVSGATGHPFLWSIVGPYVYMKAGADVGTLGDINADGVNDILVGMPYIPP